MSRIIDLNPGSGEISEISEVAGKWFAKVHSGAMSENDYLNFSTWLAASPEHEMAYQQCEKIWLLAEQALLQNTSDTPSITENNSEKHRSSLSGYSFLAQRSLKRYARAAAFGILMIGLIVVQPWFQSWFQEQSHKTVIGQQHLVVLSDGSKVFLNTNTQIHVKYGWQKREVTLLSGDAIFYVQHENLRPFEVVARNRITRAVGTQFHVSLLKDRVNVAVIEGVVEVDQIKAHPSSSVEKKPSLKKGQSLSYMTDGSISEIKRANLSRIAALRKGKLFFDNERLTDVIEQYNRYSARPLKIGSDTLKAIRISGAFHINDEQSVLFTLKESFNIHYLDKGNAIILLPQNTKNTPDRN